MNEINKIKEIYDFASHDSQSRYFATGGKSNVVKIWQISKKTEELLTEIGEIFVTDLQPELSAEEEKENKDDELSLLPSEANDPEAATAPPKKKSGEVYVTDLLTYTQPAYKNCLIILTDQKMFQIIKIKINLDPTTGVLNVDFKVQMRFPSKHFAHTLIELGCGDYIVTLSNESLEYWDLARKKRLGLYYTHFGENLLGVCVNSQTNMLL